MIISKYVFWKHSRSKEKFTGSTFLTAPTNLTSSYKIPVVQKCYLFVFCLKQLKDSLKEGSGLELLFIKVHPEEKCLPGFHDDKSLDRNITWLVMDDRSQNPRSPSQLSAPRTQIPDPRSPPLAWRCCWGGGQAWVDRASLAVSSC